MAKSKGPPTRYLLTYLGPSDVLDDSANSGFVWQRGETLEVDEATKRRFVPEALPAVEPDPRFVNAQRSQPEASPWLAMWRAEPVKETVVSVPINSEEVNDNGSSTI